MPVVLLVVTGCSAGPGVGVQDTTGSGRRSPVTLSDTGLGGLDLGMSLAQARDLGMVGASSGTGGADVCRQYHGRHGARWLYFTDDELVIIAAGPRVRTEAGIGVGSTYQEVHDAYGDRVGDDPLISRLYVNAPQAPFPAVYRLGLTDAEESADSTVTDITLQSEDRGCYE